MLLKIFVKLTEKCLCGCLLYNKVAGCKLKKDSGAGIFLWIFKNIYLVEHAQTASSDILGYPKLGIPFARSTLRKCIVFSTIFNFKLVLKYCTTSEMYLEPYQTFMMKQFCNYS